MPIKPLKTLLAVMLSVAVGVTTVSLSSNPLAARADTPTEHQMDSKRSAAPLYDDLGDHHYAISTTNPLAQRYFDQGLILAYGFNHAEAARSFRQAAALDAECAMCRWGLAYVLGPNINAPMEADAIPEAWTVIQEAIALSDHATAKEQALIQALAQRYSSNPTAAREPLDLAYANAMREVAHAYPDDAEIATLYAEALMDTTPWDYWDEAGEPTAAGAEIMALLESVLAHDANHIGANHLYIHAVEKERPELGIPSADRLMMLVPGSGHLTHMPSHIYIRVGRYHDAVVSNQNGIAADNAYRAIPCHLPGMYTSAYMPHNHHFLWFAAMMTGQRQVSLDAARITAEVDPEMMRSPELAGSLQHYSLVPLFTLIRFGQWDEILAEPAPDSDLLYPAGIWHYARGVAYLGNGKLRRASRELAQLRAIAANEELQAVQIWGFNSAASILNIASEVLAGRIAAKRDNYPQAIGHLETAIALEDALVYTEPADWYHPVRNLMAETLLAANQFEQAERYFRDDLAIYPDNGWSLNGLMRSLQAQGKTEEAKALQAQFEQAWQYADSSATDSL